MQVNNNINFRGRIFIVGNPSKRIYAALQESPQLQAFVSGKKNLLVSVLRKPASKIRDAKKQGLSGDLYRISFKLCTSRKNWLLRLWDLTSPPANLSRQYFPENRVIDWINNKPFMHRKVIEKIDFSI